ncbi:MAG: hypothetical protein ACK59W_17935, partial [Pseudanabaena sp.]
PVTPADLPMIQIAHATRLSLAEIKNGRRFLVPWGPHATKKLLLALRQDVFWLQGITKRCFYLLI